MAENKIRVVLVKKMIMGTTGVGEVTLISNSSTAKRSFVVGLVFDKAFV